MNPLPILRDSWFFFSRHLGAIALLCLPPLALESLSRQALRAVDGTQPSAGYEVLLGLLFYPLYTGSLILFLDSRSRGETPGTGRLWAGALGLWPRLALLTAITSLLIMLGMSLLVLPAIFVMVKLAFSEYLLVLRGMPPLPALRDSYRLTQGHFLQILALVLSTMLPLWLLGAWSSGWLGDDPAFLPSVLLDCAIGFVQLFASVAMFRLFMLIEEKS
ncbi:YciC family protein [Pseudomonas kuykendallii]|uniref:DUF7847 domain-containing protein n=1 Tax=Pseudomonas kuykendallii TaxID=1007099 RepID=A0A2W5D0P9_9PSED|nr:YciC family protein [Pseudomonas kuykendallii]PZP25301.1 MAG: hypothetical protein DI599_05920 [Pseudomonas kuykendallii]